MVKLARRLGYRLLCIEASETVDYEAVARLAGELGVRLCVRVTVEGRSRREVRAEIERVKKSSGNRLPLIVVNAKTVDSMRYSATCKEVALTRVEPGFEKLIDKSQARLFAQRGWGAVELTLRPLLAGSGLDYLYSAVSRALEAGVDVVVSSDSREPWEMWSPYHVVGLLVTMGVPEATARTWVSSAPARVSERTLAESMQHSQRLYQS